MNKTIENMIKVKMKELLLQCTPEQHLMFKRMYHANDINVSINEAVDNLSPIQLDLAMTQIERTIEKNKNK